MRWRGGDKQTERETETETETNRQTDRQTDRQTLRDIQQQTYRDRAVKSAEQEHSISKARVKHDRVMTKWMGDRYVLR